MVDPGNLVKADDTVLTTIVSLDPMYVYFDVDERTLLRLRRLVREGKIQSRAQEATIPVLVGLSDEDGFPHKGKINFSDNRVDPSTGTLRVRGRRSRTPSPGSSRRACSCGSACRSATPTRRSSIPEQALGTDQGQKYLYVVKEVTKDGKVQRIVEDRTVKVGALARPGCA